MILKELELKNYTRLYIPNIRYLHYFPKQHMQTILASNGSGKSSLLKEIIPNVDDTKNEYDESGYRIAKYLHRNKTYELCYVRDTNKHSFKVNGTELNEVGLMKTQKILISEHFNITKDIHDMLLSATTFTNMSVGERKRWFTDILTSIDYDFAMSKYNKVKARIKDLTSYIKLIQSKIIFDDKLLEDMTEDRIVVLKKDKEQFVSLLDDILNHRPITTPIDELSDDILFKQASAAKILHKYRDAHIDIMHNVDTLIITKELELKTLDKNIDDIKEELKNINDNGLTSDVNKQELVNDIEKISKKLKEINPTKLGYEDFKTYVKELVSIHSVLLELANDLQDSDGISVTSETIKNLNKNLIATKQQHMDVEHTITILDRDLQKQIAYSEADDVTCPKCSNIFKPNHDEQKLLVLKSELAKNYDKKSILDQELSKLTKSLDAIDVKRNLIVKLKLLLTNDSLMPLYEELKEVSNSFLDTHVLSRKISDLYATLPDYQEVSDAIEELHNLQQKLTILNSVTIDKLAYMQQLKKELGVKLTAAMKQSMSIADELNKYKIIKNDKNKLSKYYQEFKTFITKIKDVKREKYDMLLRDYYNNIIYEIKHEVANIDNKLVEYNKIHSHRDGLIKELDKYKAELKTAKLLEERLSPNKGIIGVSISTTINAVLERMNEIINSIWTYEINILPCDTMSGDLTFRFPVKLGTRKEPIPDVIKGSSAIREIIDVAFKITAMEFLDMLDFPLFLDEFAISFDPKHRTRAYEFIEELGKSKFEQIFMISHYKSMFQRFTHTDVLILDNSNINYTGVFNEKEIVTIKKDV